MYTQNQTGEFACDKATFLAIKRVYSQYFRDLHAYAARQRYFRKQIQNRRVFAYIYNTVGQRCGRKDLGPAYEPAPPALFTPRMFVPKGEHALNDMGVCELYHRARMRYEAGKVPVLDPISVGMIVKMSENL